MEEVGRGLSRPDGPLGQAADREWALAVGLAVMSYAFAFAWPVLIMGQDWWTPPTGGGTPSAPSEFDLWRASWGYQFFMAGLVGPALETLPFLIVAWLFSLWRAPAASKAAVFLTLSLHGAG